MKRLKLISELLGLDWLPIIYDEKRFPTNEGYDARLYEMFEEHKGNLKGEALKAVIDDFERRRDEEEKRLDTIEAKAFSLISLTGLASTFTIGLVEFVVTDHPYASWFRFLVLILYGMIGFCFLTTTVLARRAIRVGSRPFMWPSIENLWSLRGSNTDYVYQEHAKSLLRSFMHNRGVINDKATYVRGAQDWFRNTIILLFLVPVLFGCAALIPATSAVIDPRPNVFIVITNTPTFTPTATVVSTIVPTITPSPTP